MSSKPTSLHTVAVGMLAVLLLLTAVTSVAQEPARPADTAQPLPNAQRERWAGVPGSGTRGSARTGRPKTA